MMYFHGGDMKVMILHVNAMQYKTVALYTVYQCEEFVASPTLLVTLVCIYSLSGVEVSKRQGKHVVFLPLTPGS